MAVRKHEEHGDRQARGGLTVEGKVSLQGFEPGAHELPLRAFAFDAAGRLVGSGDVDEQGGYRFDVTLREPADVDVLVGPAVEADIVRQAEPPVVRFNASDWARAESGFRISPDIQLARRIWWPWRPIRVCVRGRVRKQQTDRPPCPVPFATVEVYDVDREGCLWPLLRPRLPDLFDKPVLRIPELVRRFPIPEPDPDPIGPVFGGAGRLDRVALNPQPLPPKAFERVGLNPQPLPPRIVDRVGLNPQPLPPRDFSAIGAAVGFDPQPEPPVFANRIGELRSLPEQIASRLDTLTLTSRLAPWLLWPRCFYSRARVCTTTTNCDGRFTCCFWWWPFHVRNGRLRFDLRPDIVIKVTQEIDGVQRVIYLDPYTSTRWDRWGAYIDLLLDDEDILCGSGCTPTPEGTSTFFVRVGNDEVYKIGQVDGLFNDTAFGGAISNMAYGGGLHVHAVFGDTLSAAAPQFYYRLSILGPTTGGVFKPIKAKLSDTRVHKVTNFSEQQDLGPFTVGTSSNLYKVRDTATYHWYNQDLVGTWDTSSAADAETHVPDEGLYTLRLEVFDNAGTQLTSATIDYLDGTEPPPALLPAMVDACDLILRIDNKPPVVSLSFPAVVNPCGVVPVTATPFDFTAHVHQENGRLHSWGLGYVKGLNIDSGPLGGNSSNSGLATVNESVSSAPMTNGLTGTCAFSLTIGAWSHIRNGYGLIYHESEHYALAVEKCPECPPSR
jgi:hypothetical protein